MQRVGAVVLGQGVRLAVEGEGAVCDAIRVPPDDRTEVGRIGCISLQRVMPESDIRELAFAIGHADGENDAAVIHGVDFESVRVCERIQGDWPSFPRAERLLLHAGLVLRSRLSEKNSVDRYNKSEEICKRGASRHHGEKCTTVAIILDWRHPWRRASGLPPETGKHHTAHSLASQSTRRRARKP